MAKRGENIRKRKDGRWEGRFLQEKCGSKSYHSVYAKTYREVKEKLLAEKILHRNAIRAKIGRKYLIFVLYFML